MVNEDKNKEVEGKRMASVLVNTATPTQICMKSIDCIGGNRGESAK